MNDYGFGGIDGRDMAIRELEDRGAAYRQRIADLEAQVTRLQRTIMALGTWISPSWDEDMDRTEATMIVQKHYTNDTMKWGDLDPVKGGNDGE